MSMFSIRIEDGLKVTHHYERPQAPAVSERGCMIQDLVELGYSFEEARKIISPSYLARRELDKIFRENGFVISREEVQEVIEKFNLVVLA